MTLKALSLGYWHGNIVFHLGPKCSAIVSQQKSCSPATGQVNYSKGTVVLKHPNQLQCIHLFWGEKAREQMWNSRSELHKNYGILCLLKMPGRAQEVLFIGLESVKICSEYPATQLQEFAVLFKRHCCVSHVERVFVLASFSMLAEKLPDHSLHPLAVLQY